MDALEQDKSSTPKGQEAASSPRSQPPQVNAEMLRDAILNFIIAGRDTTACTLTWTTFILATHPEVQQRVCAEVDTICPKGTDPSSKLVQAASMPQLNALVYEALRLYPPVPLDSKEVGAGGATLPDGTRLSAGQKISYLPW